MKNYRFQSTAQTLGMFVFMVSTLAISACPLCDSPTGQQVRAGIFNQDFGMTLLIVLSPFPVLLLVLAAMHFGLPRFGKRASDTPVDIPNKRTQKTKIYESNT